ncbi:MAG: hypothetical protein FRX49_02074 [Trebouxia sp. A1-2]|nr:MAG: hypothetical protein FRX49_02074 [Trebouxia sp. A1-2]
MLGCICCGPLPLEGGIPGHINFQEEKARQPNGKNADRPDLTLPEQDTIQREVARYKQSHIQCGTAYGELDHPSYDSVTFKDLHMATVCHQVLQVWWHGDDLHGLVEVLDTPAGRLVRGLYCQGFMFGASSRGWSCTLPQEEYSVIGDDFQLFAFDLLLRPATTSYLFPVREQFQSPVSPDRTVIAAANRGSQGIVACYPSLQMHAMRDARGLHSDLKKTASLELLHQQQVEAEERQCSLAAPDSGLGSSHSSAVKGRFLGRKNSGGKEALLPRHQRTSSQGNPNFDMQSSSIKAVHLRHSSPTRGLVGHKSPIRDTQHRLQKTQKLLDVLQFGQLHEQVSGQQEGHIERFLIDVLAAQDYRNRAPAAVRQIPPLRKVPELQSLLPPERRHRAKSSSKPHRHQDSNAGGYVPLMEAASSVASASLMDESQLQETAPVVRLSADLLRTQVDAAPSGDCSQPQPITM